MALSWSAGIFIFLFSYVFRLIGSLSSEYWHIFAWGSSGQQRGQGSSWDMAPVHYLLTCSTAAAAAATTTFVCIYSGGGGSSSSHSSSSSSSIIMNDSA